MPEGAFIHRLGAFAAAAALAISLTGGAQAQTIPESPDPIRLGVADWTGQHITTYIAGFILEDMGYNVEYVTAAVHPSAMALADGNLSASLEWYSNSIGEFLPKLIDSGEVEYLGELGIAARDGWIVPAYMEEHCPGLPEWDALVDCAEVFATPESFPDGRLLAYPIGWGDRSIRLVENEDVPFIAVPAGSEGALISELRSAAQREAPILLMLWEPHWIMTEIPMMWIEKPEEIIERYSFEIPTLFKAGWPGMKDKWPMAHQFLKNYQINGEIQAELMLQIDHEGVPLEEAVGTWVEENRDFWEPMVPTAG